MLRWLTNIVLGVLILAVLSGSMGASLIQLNYAINLESIIEEFCVNKDKPIMQCNGQCHLAKQLKQHEEKRQQSQPNEQEETLVLNWVAESTEMLPVFPTTLFAKGMMGDQVPLSGYPSAPEHPPSNA